MGKALPSDGLQDNFNFELVGTDEALFSGYASSPDKTRLSSQLLARGSQNVFKKRNGNLAPRPGMKTRGETDDTDAGIVSSYEWETSLGALYPLRVVSDGRLQVESDVTGELLWYTLATDIDHTRYVFDAWWDDVYKKDELIFCKGDSGLETWSGGIAQIESISTETDGVVSATIGSAGTGYVVGDILTLTGGDDNATAVVNDALGGAIISVAILNPGAGYTSATYSVSGGSGSGATLNATVGDAIHVTKVGDETWAEAGFDPVVYDATHGGSNNEVTVNGDTYQYRAGEDTRTLIFLDTVIASEPVGSVVIQTIISITNTPGDSFSNDFLRVIYNQVWIGSYTSRLVYISASDDIRNYVVPTPREVGDPELLTLDATIRGIGVRNGQPAIFAGLSYLYLHSYKQVPINTTSGGTTTTIVTETSSLDRKDLADLEAALAHEYIDTVGDDLIFLCQDHQVRKFGTFRNLNEPLYPSISQPLYQELAEETFNPTPADSDGALRAIGDDIYLTAKTSGKTYVYEVRDDVNPEGNIVAERIWFSPMIWGVSRVALIDGEVYGHSTQNPMIFKLWDTDQWHDDGPAADLALPYTSVARFGYINNGDRFHLKFFDKVAYEGYLWPNAPLKAKILYEYQSAREEKTGVISNNIKSPTLFYESGVFGMGGAPVGTLELGGGSEPLEENVLPKFRMIADVTPVKVFEFELEVYSDEADARWELICLGTNAMLCTDMPTFIRQSFS